MKYTSIGSVCTEAGELDVTLRFYQDGLARRTRAHLGQHARTTIVAMGWFPLVTLR